MKTCIICREPKEAFNDEHVIPDSIKGYYHIYSVCVDCNSIMGGKVDVKLTNHKFIEFQRHLLGIKGKKGAIPNPFSGTHHYKDDPSQKVRLEVDNEGKFVPKLLPMVPEGITTQFTISLDKKDIKQKDIIINKFLKRHGLERDQVQITEKTEKIENKWIHSQLTVDIHEFKLAMLKIAYEFTVDQIPEYFEDPQAKVISSMLYQADFEKLEEKVQTLGTGFEKQLLESFSHLFNFDEKNHYLILFDTKELGLFCFVKLFHFFSIGFKMSDGKLSIPDGLLMGKNDIEGKTFKVYRLKELIAMNYTIPEYRFRYFIPETEFIEFKENEKSTEFDFFKIEGGIPFFDKNENVVYQHIDLKLQQQNLELVSKGKMPEEMITEVIIDNEELYIKLLPNGKLYRVLSVQMEQFLKVNN